MTQVPRWHAWICIDHWSVQSQSEENQKTNKVRSSIDKIVRYCK